LNLYPYKMTVLPKLTVQNKHQRNVRVSDEAHFQLDDVVNKQNVQATLGVRELVRFMRRCILHRELQRGLPSQIMDCYGQHSLKRQWTVSVIYACCAILLCLTFLLQVCHYRFSGSCRMQPGCTQRILDFLHDTFDSRVISNRFPDCFTCGQNWPPNSSDLNP
jgi:hypothetical protein